MSDARRALARPGRLRWLDAIRRGEFLFEVYEAPGGASLSACIQRGASFDWAATRRILADLAAELAQASEPVCIAQVWIDRTWNARLLDEPIGNEGLAPRKPLELLSDVARLLIRDHRLLPLTAEPVVNRLLGEAGPYASLAEAARDLEELARRPTRLTPTARALQIAVAGLSPVLALAFMTLSMFALAGPIERFVECINYIEQLRKDEASPPPADRLDDEDRKAREIVIASAEGTPWIANFSDRLDPTQRGIQKRAVAAHPSPPAEEVAWARQRIAARPFKDGVANLSTTTVDVGPGSKVSVTGDGSGGGMREARWKVLPMMAAWIIGGWGVLSTILALSFRGGLSFKLFGTGVRTQSGALASRLRCAWRSLVVWVPLTALYGTGAWFSAAGRGALGGALVLLAAAIHVACIAYAIARPSRGVQDRLAGTQLVPR